MGPHDARNAFDSVWCFGKFHDADVLGFFTSNGRQLSTISLMILTT